MSCSTSGLERDSRGAVERFREDLIEGLSHPQKQIPCKYLYDERGSKLFERICELEEYYPTRAEMRIMESNASEIADRLGSRCLLVEYGSGSSKKTRLLLEQLDAPVGYVPIDISCDTLERSAAALARAYAELEVMPVCADYTGPLRIPVPSVRPDRRAVYFPGSTIGNFTPAEARGFLEQMSGVAGEAGGLLVGVDLKKDLEILERAYDDGEGVTAEFNKNLLARANRELGAEFPLERFYHRARYDADHGRVEMHLVTDSELSVSIGDAEVRFEAGETIHTENSYKYDLDEFAEVATNAGLRVEQVWTDPDGLFSVQYLQAR